MITGSDRAATMACDWPGCVTVIHWQRTGDESAIDGVARVAARYFCWQPGYIIASSLPPLDICGAHTVAGWVGDD